MKSPGLRTRAEVITTSKPKLQDIRPHHQMLEQAGVPETPFNRRRVEMRAQDGGNNKRQCTQAAGLPTTESDACERTIIKELDGESKGDY